MAHATLQSALRLLYPLLTVWVLLLSPTVAAHTDVSLPSTPVQLLENTTQPDQVPTTVLSQCGIHLCCINVPADSTTIVGAQSATGPIYACYQQVAVASSYSPDIPPPR